MKNFPALITAFILFIMLGGVQVSSAEQWYFGGTLQGATIAQWQVASYNNQLATAATWAITEPGIRKISQRTSTMASIKPYAEELVGCISKMTAADRDSENNVESLATNCMIILGW